MADPQRISTDLAKLDAQCTADADAAAAAEERLRIAIVEALEAREKSHWSYIALFKAQGTHADGKHRLEHECDRLGFKRTQSYQLANRIMYVGPDNFIRRLLGW